MANPVFEGRFPYDVFDLSVSIYVFNDYLDCILILSSLIMKFLLADKKKLYVAFLDWEKDVLQN